MPKQKLPKEPSKKYMFALVRKAALRLWGSCIFCGNPNEQELEVHHIIHRANAILKYDIDNNVPLCSTPWKNCHREADTNAGRDRIRKILGEEKWNKLITLEPKTLRDHLKELKISEHRWLLEKKSILQDIIENA